MGVWLNAKGQDMASDIKTIVDQLKALETELETAISREQAEMAARFEGGRVRFEAEALALQKRMKQNLFGYLRETKPLNFLTAPFIYALIVPFALLDLLLWVYQTICFPVYGMPKVRRSDYFVFDRGGLAYLNAIEKLNCAYCSYGNGVLAYASEVASRTEQYWCPIKHARRVLGAHRRYRNFVEFGDAEAYHRELETLRRALAQDKPA